MNTRHVRIVTGFELARLFRSAHGWLFLSFFVIFYGWALTRLAEMASEIAQLGAGGAMNIAGGFLSWWTDLSGSTLERMFTEHPPLLVSFFALAVVATPALAMLGSFDQAASDIGNKHVRFLLMRTDRASLYVGKSLGVLIVFALAMALVTAAVGAVALAKGATDGFGLASVVGYLLRIWLTSVAFAIPFIALMGLAGALTGMPLVALLIGFGFQFVIWMISSLGGMANETLAKVSLAFPTHFRYQLISDQLADLLKGAAHVGLFALVFFAAGLLVFRRRDV